MTQNLTTMDLSEGLKYLNSMFPYLDTEIILCVLAKNLYKFEETIENLLEFQQEKKQTCKFQDNDNLFIETYNITSNTNEIKKNQLNFRLDISEKNESDHSNDSKKLNIFASNSEEEKEEEEFFLKIEKNGKNLNYQKINKNLYENEYKNSLKNIFTNKIIKNCEKESSMIQINRKPKKFDEDMNENKLKLNNKSLDIIHIDENEEQKSNIKNKNDNSAYCNKYSSKKYFNLFNFYRLA